MEPEFGIFFFFSLPFNSRFFISPLPVIRKKFDLFYSPIPIISVPVLHTDYFCSCFPYRLFLSPIFHTCYLFPLFRAWSPNFTELGSFPHCMTFICSGEISLKAAFMRVSDFMIPSISCLACTDVSSAGPN